MLGAWFAAPSNCLFRDRAEVSRVIGFPMLPDQHGKLIGIDESHPVGNLLRAGDLGSLAPFERSHEFGRLQQTVRRTRVEPSISPAHHFDLELTPVEISLVDVGNLELAAS